MDPVTITGAVLGALAAIFGFVFLLFKFYDKIKQTILKEANDHSDSLHKESMGEIKHIKEFHGSKLDEMSKKIDELRDALSEGQKATMELLTKMINKDK